MVLGKLPVPGRPTIWMIVGQGPIALAIGAGWGGLDIFTLLYPFSPLSPSLWETARYRLKYCLKGPLNPVQPTKSNMLPEKTHQIQTRLLRPVVQSTVSLTSSLRGQLFKCFTTLLPNTVIFFVEKIREAFALQKLLTFFQQKIKAYFRY